MAKKRTIQTSFLDNDKTFFVELWKGNLMVYTKTTPRTIRKARLEEIVPDKLFWKQSHTRPNEYYECRFSPQVNYSTIQELEPRIYVED